MIGFRWYLTGDNRIAITGGTQCLDDNGSNVQQWACTPGNTNQSEYMKSTPPHPYPSIVFWLTEPFPYLAIHLPGRYGTLCSLLHSRDPSPTCQFLSRSVVFIFIFLLVLLALCHALHPSRRHFHRSSLLRSCWRWPSTTPSEPKRSMLNSNECKRGRRNASRDASFSIPFLTSSH